MPCITYGFFVFIMIIISMAVMLVTGTSVIIYGEDGRPHLAQTRTAVYGGAFIFLSALGLFVWWIWGFFSDCKDGYAWSNLRKS